MAPRATDTEVRKIIDVSRDVDDTTPFIMAANSLVNAKCTSSGYSEDLLTVIENWLAAHFLAMRDPRLSSESAGISASYQNRIDMFLALSHYGQQAMLLDYEGNLSALNKKIGRGKASIGASWLGTELKDKE
jgi:hypothetical protein